MDRLLRLGHGNGRNEQSLVRFVRDADADSFSCNESQRLTAAIRRIPGHRVTVAGEDWAETRNRARQTCIVTRSTRDNLGEITVLASGSVPGFDGVGHDRILVASFYAHPVARKNGAKGIAHFALHAAAGPDQLKGNNPDAPLVKANTEGLVTARTMLAAARTLGFLIFLTGDLNQRQEWHAEWSPVKLIAEPLRLNYESNGLDWMLSDKRVTRKGPLHSRQLADHVGFTADFEA